LSGLVGKLDGISVYITYKKFEIKNGPIHSVPKKSFILDFFYHRLDFASQIVGKIFTLKVNNAFCLRFDVFTKWNASYMILESVFRHQHVTRSNATQRIYV
jgi:hypothetical protein